MHRHRHNKDTRDTVLKIAAVVFAALLLLSCILFALDLWERNHSAYHDGPAPMEDTLTYNGVKYTLREDIETLLLIGLDTYEDDGIESYNNHKQADFLLLLVVDHQLDTFRAIHINRDTMAEFNILGVAGDRIGTTTRQIALSHTYGNGREVSCRNTANAVSTLLGIDVDHYVSVTMDAVPVYNDLVGGVTVEVLDDFTGIDDALVLGTTVTLTGESALRYVRARYGLEDPTNTHRMKRQKQYLEALYERTRLRVREDESFVSRAALAMTDYLVSDCSANKLESMMSHFAEHQLDAIYSIEGETVAGAEFAEFYPDEASLRQVVIDCFYQPKN